MAIVYILIALLGGTAIGWFFAKGKFQNNNVSLDDLQKAQEARMRAEVGLESAQKHSLRIETELDRTRLDIVSLSMENAAKSEELKGLGEKLTTQKAELLQAREQLNKDFELLANRIFEEKSQRFTDQNRSNLDVILNPLKEKIREFEDKVDKAYKSEAAERNSLRGEIINLVEASARISNDAKNLAQALKGDQKMQGNWGELILDKVLERSGLTEGVEYKRQVSVQDEHDKRVQPDVMVFLPDDKHIIIDSKVSLKAYEQFVNCETEEQKRQFIDLHLESLRNHIKGLSEKNYPASKNINAPDFVLMFIPIESSFSSAIQEDLDLFNFAWDRKIVLVSPSTLLATLKTIASLWKQERQNSNVLEIAIESGKLYDKFVGLMEDLTDIGKKLDGTQTAYRDAMRKIVDGSGNLVGKVEKLKKLGAKTNKSISENLLKRSSEE